MMPVFPRLGKVDTNPRPWLSAEEWRDLQAEGEARIKDAGDEAGNHRHKRADMLAFARLMVATCMRVDELRSVRVRDVKILKSTRVTYGGKTIDPLSARATKLKPDSNEYLEIELRQGKRGARTVVTRPALSGVETFRDLVKRKSLKPGDLLFDAHHRDAFRELLIAAGLRESNGIKRNLKACRPTGLMLWILAEPNVNLKLLADNAGTSIAMLEAYYLKPLNVRINRDALVG